MPSEAAATASATTTTRRVRSIASGIRTAADRAAHSIGTHERLHVQRERLAEPAADPGHGDHPQQGADAVVGGMDGDEGVGDLVVAGDHVPALGQHPDHDPRGGHEAGGTPAQQLAEPTALSDRQRARDRQREPERALGADGEDDGAGDGGEEQEGGLGEGCGAGFARRDRGRRSAEPPEAGFAGVREAGCAAGLGTGAAGLAPASVVRPRPSGFRPPAPLTTLAAASALLAGRPGPRQVHQAHPQQQRRRDLDPVRVHRRVQRDRGRASAPSAAPASSSGRRVRIATVAAVAANAEASSAARIRLARMPCHVRPEAQRRADRQVVQRVVASDPGHHADLRLRRRAPGAGSSRCGRPSSGPGGRSGSRRTARSAAAGSSGPRTPRPAGAPAGPALRREQVAGHRSVGALQVLALVGGAVGRHGQRPGDGQQGEGGEGRAARSRRAKGCAPATRSRSGTRCSLRDSGSGSCGGAGCPADARPPAVPPAGADTRRVTGSGEHPSRSAQHPVPGPAVARCASSARARPQRASSATPEESCVECHAPGPAAAGPPSSESSQPAESERPGADVPDGSGPAGRPAAGRRLGRLLRPRTDAGTAALVAVVVAVLAQIPLLTNRFFYLWDDSAAEFLPVWHRIGADLLAGHWNPLVPGMWNGGDFAAEALFGIWNPVELLDAVFTALTGDLLIAAIVIKTQFLVLLTLGIYAVCREYRLEPRRRGRRRGRAAVLRLHPLLRRRLLDRRPHGLRLDHALLVVGAPLHARPAEPGRADRLRAADRHHRQPLRPAGHGGRRDRAGRRVAGRPATGARSGGWPPSARWRPRRPRWCSCRWCSAPRSPPGSPGSGIMNTGFLVPGRRRPAEPVRPGLPAALGVLAHGVLVRTGHVPGLVHRAAGAVAGLAAGAAPAAHADRRRPARGRLPGHDGRPVADLALPLAAARHRVRLPGPVRRPGAGAHRVAAHRPAPAPRRGHRPGSSWSAATCRGRRSPAGRTRSSPRPCWSARCPG